MRSLSPLDLIGLIIRLYTDADWNGDGRVDPLDGFVMEPNLCNAHMVALRASLDGDAADEGDEVAKLIM